MSSGSIYIWLLFWIQGVDGEYKGVHSPISRTFSRPPTPFQSMDCGIWPLSIWLCTIPNRFVHLGPWSLGPFVFPFKMQSDLTVIATGISILLQYLNHTLEPNEGDTWTISAMRCENVEEILKLCQKPKRCVPPWLVDVKLVISYGFNMC